MISGVHFNFSFTEDFIKKLYEITDFDLDYQDFKNEIYLKITRNYLRHCWLIIYLTGCSIGSHESFSKECIHLMDEVDAYGNHYSTRGPSLRNSSCGYKNLKRLYPRYTSVEDFADDVNSFIERGDLSQAKELYTQIRLKPKDPSDLLNSLKNDGIKYIEVRTLDMLVKSESDFECWQSEAFINEERVAEKAYDDTMRLVRDGKEITIKQWAYEIINEMYGMCEVLGFDEFDTLKLMHDRVLNPDLTYGKRLLELIRKEGYINAHMNLAINNKKTSVDKIKKLEESNSPEFRKYFSLALKDE